MLYRYKTGDLRLFFVTSFLLLRSVLYVDYRNIRVSFVYQAERADSEQEMGYNTDRGDEQNSKGPLHKVNFGLHIWKISPAL